MIIKLTNIQLKNTQNKLKIEIYKGKQCSKLVFGRGVKLRSRGCSASEVAMKQCLSEKEVQTKEWTDKLKRAGKAVRGERKKNDKIVREKNKLQTLFVKLIE